MKFQAFLNKIKSINNDPFILIKIIGSLTLLLFTFFSCQSILIKIGFLVKIAQIAYLIAVIIFMGYFMFYSLNYKSNENSGLLGLFCGNIMNISQILQMKEMKAINANFVKTIANDFTLQNVINTAIHTITKQDHKERLFQISNIAIILQIAFAAVIITYFKKYKKYELRAIITKFKEIHQILKSKSQSKQTLKFNIRD